MTRNLGIRSYHINEYRKNKRNHTGAGFFSTIGKFARPILHGAIKYFAPKIESKIKNFAKKKILDGGKILTNYMLQKAKNGGSKLGGKKALKFTVGGRSRGRGAKVARGIGGGRGRARGKVAGAMSKIVRGGRGARRGGGKRGRGARRGVGGRATGGRGRGGGGGRGAGRGVGRGGGGRGKSGKQAIRVVKKGGKVKKIGTRGAVRGVKSVGGKRTKKNKFFSVL